MIPIKEVEQIHKLLISTFGGSHGIRDIAALESALARPFQTFEEKELYPTIVGKAASLIESILVNTLSLMEIKEQDMSSLGFSY